MKKIIFTGLLGIGMMFSAQAQLKVVSSGNTIVGGSDPGVANFKTQGSSELELGLDASSGNPDFTMQTLGKSKAQFKYNNALAGVELLVHAGSNTDAGLGSLYQSMFLSGQNQRVGIGTTAPASALHVAGEITYAGGSIGSDRRLKSDIQEFDLGLKELLTIEPKTYFYNGKAGIDSESKQVGIIAQDLQKIAPDFVGSFAYQEFKYEEGGEETTILGTQEYLTVNAQVIQFMLVNSVKEQQKELEEKDAKIAELENLLHDLSARVEEIVNQTNVSLGGVLSDAGEVAQNIPNPFISETQINYLIPVQASSAQVNVYDINGRLLRSIPINHTGKGMINLDAGDISAGTYSYQLVVDNQIIGAKKMVKSK